MAVKCNLSRILGEKKMKMSELAEEAGVAKNTVMGLYHERAKGITFEVLEKICRVLNCPVGELIEIIEEKE